MYGWSSSETRATPSCPHLGHLIVSVNLSRAAILQYGLRPTFRQAFQISNGPDHIPPEGSIIYNGPLAGLFRGEAPLAARFRLSHAGKIPDHVEERLPGFGRKRPAIGCGGL